MAIKPITYTQKQYKPNFGAKFLDSDSLKEVAQYAVEHGKFDKLNQARKNIDTAFLQTRLLVDVGESANGKPFIIFTKYAPKKNVLVAKTMEDFEIVKTSKYSAEKKQNVLKFALEKILKLGNNAPHNNMYKNVVISKK